MGSNLCTTMPEGTTPEKDSCKSKRGAETMTIEDHILEHQPIKESPSKKRNKTSQRSLVLELEARIQEADTAIQSDIMATLGDPCAEKEDFSFDKTTVPLPVPPKAPEEIPKKKSTTKKKKKDEDEESKEKRKKDLKDGAKTLPRLVFSREYQDKKQAAVKKERKMKAHTSPYYKLFVEIPGTSLSKCIFCGNKITSTKSTNLTQHYNHCHSKPADHVITDEPDEVLLDVGKAVTMGSMSFLAIDNKYVTKLLSEEY